MYQGGGPHPHVASAQPSYAAGQLQQRGAFLGFEYHALLRMGEALGNLHAAPLQQRVKLGQVGPFQAWCERLLAHMGDLVLDLPFSQPAVGVQATGSNR